MKKLILNLLALATVLLLSACAGASTTSPIGVSCLPGTPVQDKNPDCTGGG
uniref:Lipoprotein n=1 Tax=Polynucleobacter necessarius subsp. necessarius (strain STIR1) TaxID=452638 RepID=B1XSM5_POLNS